MKFIRQLSLSGVMGILVVCLLSAAAVAASPSLASPQWHWARRPRPHWNAHLVGTKTRLVYERIGRRPLTLYLFEPKAASATPRPLVIYIHGGSLRFGSAMITSAKTPHNQLLVSVEQNLIRHGIDFASLNYRLAPLHPWPIPLHDVKHAVWYLHNHAQSLGINSQRMAVMGDSAGGELSTFVGLTMSRPSQHRPLVRGVVDLFGPTNRRTFAAQWTKRYGLTPNPVYGVYTSRRVRQESAVSYVHPHAPAFLIVQGTRDHVVPPGQSALLKKRLAQVHVPVHEILVHHAGHELVSVDGPIRPGIPQIARRIDQFLDQELLSSS